MIDASGKIRYFHFGEGGYEETEKHIQELLIESGAELDEIPDIVITSTAVRAKTTVELAMKAGAWSSELRLDRSIYGSATGTLLDILHNSNNNFGVICLAGHEPTFSSFISNCTNSGWIRFPTASMARVDFDVSAWKEIRLGQGNLTWIKRPKELN